MCDCEFNIVESTCKCCTLLRGPKRIILQTRSNGCSLNFSLDGNPQFDPIKVADGERTVEIYQCHNVPGYKEVFVTIVSQKERPVA